MADANSGAGELAVEIDLAADGLNIEGMTIFTDPNVLQMGELRPQATTRRTGRQTFVNRPGLSRGGLDLPPLRIEVQRSTTA